MAYLYQEIMKVPGLSGNWSQRLNEFGKRFYGNSYTGSTSQNLNLLSRIQRGDYGAAPAQVASPANTASDYVSAITGGTRANAATQFEKMLPYKSYLNSMLQGNRTGFDEIQREEAANMGNTLSNYDLNSTRGGANRFGSYYTNRGRMADELVKQKTDRLSAYQNQLENTINTQYQALVDQYWKDPNIDTYKSIAATTTTVPSTPLYDVGAQYGINF